LTNCTVSGNSTGGYDASASGGGIYNNYGLLTLNQCTLSGNSEDNNYGGGGGIYNDGALTLNQCTLSGNYATGDGGGIYNDEGTATLNQCTLSGNNTSYLGAGGGIFNESGTATLNQCTLSGNSADYAYGIGGGIYNGGTLTLTNTIVGGNSGSPGADIYNSATLTYGGSNLVQSVYVYGFGATITGPAPLTNAPNLAPLGNYGGRTQTMPPLPGSPAIGAGSVAANTFATDQRGYARTQNGLIDLGAVEVQPPTSITKLANGDILIQFSGGFPGILYDVEESSNLLTWTVAATDPANAMGSFSFEDTNTAGVPMQFYRTALAFTVGGTLTGLRAGETVTLQDNGGDDLTLSTNGTFTFPTALPDGHAYSVTVSGTGGLPPGAEMICALTTGSGTISGANVTNVAVQCTAPPPCPELTGNRDLDMYNAAVLDGTAHGGVPGVMLTQHGGPFRVTADGPFSNDVCREYSTECVFTLIVGTGSCSSTTLPTGGNCIQFGTVLECGDGFYQN
jgi:hypothetical protein